MQFKTWADMLENIQERVGRGWDLAALGIAEYIA
jgi:hypothetical protein